MDKEKIITIVLVLVIIIAMVSIFMTTNDDNQTSESFEAKDTSTNQGSIQFTIIEPPANSGGGNE